MKISARDRVIVENGLRDIVIRPQIQAHIATIKKRVSEKDYKEALGVYRDTIRECYGRVGLEVLEKVYNGMICKDYEAQRKEAGGGEPNGRETCLPLLR